MSITVYIGPSAPPVDPKLLAAIAALIPLRSAPRQATEDDGYANPDDYVDRMGRYYSSEYVAKNQPWVRDLPFEEWLARRIGEVTRG